MLLLSRRGIGRKAIAEITGLDERTLGRIRNGQTRFVRRGTQELIFSVPFDAHSDGALVDARPTLQLVKRLTRPDIGFTKAEIACRINPSLRKKNRMATLRLGRRGGGKKITARTAMKIEQLFNQVMAA